ncbi:MAG: nitrogenase component 1 [Pleomorphochaeta sp.]
MSFCSTKNCLHFASPAHGGWGVVRVGMLIPQSYQLFVCPFACGRHGAIGAIQQGLKNRLSYLYLSQSDIIDGYEDLIVDTMPSLISQLDEEIKVILVFVSCLDDLIGTDTISLKDRLNEKYPKYTFQICHMNPITGDTKSPPMVTIQKNIYELLDNKKTNPNLIVTLGNFEALNDDNDLKSFLKANHFNLLHISETKSFEEFKDLASSRLNLVIAPSGVLAAKHLKNKLNIPYLFLPTSYSLDEIAQQYNEISTFLDIDVNKLYFEEKKQIALSYINEALDKVKNRNIVVANSATNRVFSLSLALLKYGFNVTTIYAQSCPKIELNSKEIIENNYPNISIKQVLHHTLILGKDKDPQCVAIGIEGAYATNSKFPVQAEGDHKMYGYQAVISLMKSIIESVDSPKTIEELLDLYKLVI